MLSRKATTAEVAAQVRRALKDGGSAEHAAGVQWFFKEEIKSHGKEASSGGWFHVNCFSSRIAISRFAQTPSPCLQ